MMTYRLAVEADDEAIHRLNYETFVEEIPQHEPNATRRLVDRFHAENTYWIGEQAGEIVAMCALRTNRPSSLEEKGVVLPDGKWMEVRLLAVKKTHRGTRTFAGLMRAVMMDAIGQDVDGLVISGTTRELKLYGRFGFVPFAEAIGPDTARYVPMVLTREAFLQSESHHSLRQHVLLAGPVTLSEKVRQALATPPMPHRSDETRRLVESIQQRLMTLTGLPYVYTMLGSGTVANDAVASQLNGHGLILVGGEFGHRLVDHARRARKTFDVLPVDASGKWETSRLQNDAPEWVWTVHCETSTGVLVDLEPLRTFEGVVAIDAMSAIGTMSTDYRAMDYVTFSSGKALRCAPGLAFVATRQTVSSREDVPRYLDLALYDPIAFTQSSSLLRGMDVALRELTPEVMATHGQKVNVLRDALAASGVSLVVGHDAQAPGIVTIHLPDTIASLELGRQLAYHGYLVQYESDYLVRQNWLQISTMGWSSVRVLRDVATLIGTYVQQKTVMHGHDGVRRENLDGPNDESFVRGVLS